MQELKKSAASMDYQAGRAVGSLSRFMRIPYERREQFTAKIAAAWHLCGSDKEKPNRFYESYMNGVFDGEGPWDSLTTSDHGGFIEDVQRDEHDENSDSADDTIEVEHSDYRQCNATTDEQALIDAQLHSELLTSLRLSSDISRSHSTSIIEEDGAPFGPSIPSPVSRLGKPRHQLSETSQDAKPRSSNSFTFQRWAITGARPDWEVLDSRDNSPTATERSVLDTFTSELLVKAEEASTVGSFGRGPSTVRDASEVQVLGREEEKEEQRADNEGNDASPHTALGENSVTVDLSSDEDGPVVVDISTDDDGETDLGPEIIGCRSVRR